ncbi:MAG: hypothetical protein ACRCUE_15135 [Bosea sp. (in: a-proteobacteria)]
MSGDEGAVVIIADADARLRLAVKATIDALAGPMDPQPPIAPAVDAELRSIATALNGLTQRLDNVQLSL